MEPIRLVLAILAALSVLAAALVGALSKRLESSVAQSWASVFGEKLVGRKAARQPLIIWLGVAAFLCLGMASAAVREILPTPTPAPPIITVVVPAAAEPGQSPAAFSPIVEEFSSSKDFVQTSPNVYIEGNQVNCNVSRSGGDQFVYRNIQPISGDFRFTVIGQINSWTNNCGCQVGIGDQVNRGAFVQFGYFGGGCPVSGPTIFPGGGLSHTFEHLCLGSEDWPWFDSGVPYRAAVEIRGVEVTLFVEGQKVSKFFGTNSYTGNYNTLWVGLRGDGDWPECSVTIESTTIEPIK